MVACENARELRSEKAEARAEWQRPVLRKVDARDAEAGFNPGPDATFS